MTLQEIPSESFRERSIPVLETERLVLRAPRLGDAKTVAMLANDRRIAENTARLPHPYRVADAEDFIATANFGNETVFFITLRNGTLIGACGYTQVDRHPPEIGYWLGVKHWGKGYATEAVRAILRWAETPTTCIIHPENTSSLRVAAKCGYQERCRTTYKGEPTVLLTRP